LLWLATAAMREELARVLAYPKLAPRVTFHRGSADAVLQDFDRHARLVEPAAKAEVTCGDPDDQKFIDLAVAHRCVLLSKDDEVLRMRKRLAFLHVTAAAVLPS
jgi:predicted nucleic acid-binding protein